uniref:Putative ino80 complex subunit c n=1 Tax=Rhipicephalus pulchellus TaxID=72859 RepID=L7LS69_RHIPC
MGKKRPRPEPEKKEEEMDRPSTSKEPSTSSKQPSAQQQSQSSSTSTKSKPRVWKSLKQVVTAERLQPGAYAALEAAPSLRPWRKYSDLTGLVAPYTDPKTKLRRRAALPVT